MAPAVFERNPWLVPLLSVWLVAWGATADHGANSTSHVEVHSLQSLRAIPTPRLTNQILVAFKSSGFFKVGEEDADKFRTALKEALEYDIGCAPLARLIQPYLQEKPAGGKRVVSRKDLLDRFLQDWISEAKATPEITAEFDQHKDLVSLVRFFTKKMYEYAHEVSTSRRSSFRRDEVPDMNIDDSQKDYADGGLAGITWADYQLDSDDPSTYGVASMANHDCKHGGVCDENLENREWPDNFTKNRILDPIDLDDEESIDTSDGNFPPVSGMKSNGFQGDDSISTGELMDLDDDDDDDESVGPKRKHTGFQGNVFKSTGGGDLMDLIDSDDEGDEYAFDEDQNDDAATLMAMMKDSDPRGKHTSVVQSDSKEFRNDTLVKEGKADDRTEDQVESGAAGTPTATTRPDTPVHNDLLMQSGSRKIRSRAKHTKDRAQ